MMQPRKLTSESLSQFKRSEAMVRVVRGEKQSYCGTISDAQGQPSTRWDAAVLSCDEKEVCDVHNINQFNQEAPKALPGAAPVIPPEAKAEKIVKGTPGTKAGDTSVPDSAEAEPYEPLFD